jgi:hypothetical protein
MHNIDYSVCTVVQAITQRVDAGKTSVINRLAYTGLRDANCKDDDTEPLDNLHSLLEESHACSPNPCTSHGRETMMVVVALIL